MNWRVRTGPPFSNGPSTVGWEPSSDGPPQTCKSPRRESRLTLGLGPSIAQQNDNNYIALGFVTAGVWVMIAIVVALLIYIARDVRKSREANA